jgi:hypothetical protein
MTKLIINSEDVCLAKYIDKPYISSWPLIQVEVTCGSCNLTFATNNYIPDKNRYISNCPHCGKWNRLNLYTMGVKERRFLTTS